MALSEFEQVAQATKNMEAAIYGALEAVDSYRDLLSSLIEGQQSGEQTNEKLVKRYEQFRKRAESMTTHLEDDVVDDLLYCLHRLFIVDITERNEFI